MLKTFIWKGNFISLNYDHNKNIDIKTEIEKFENTRDDSLLRNSGWYLAPKYVEFKAKADLINYSNVAEFVLKRKTNFLTNMFFVFSREIFRYGFIFWG